MWMGVLVEKLKFRGVSDSTYLNRFYTFFNAYISTIRDRVLSVSYIYTNYSLTRYS